MKGSLFPTGVRVALFAAGHERITTVSTALPLLICAVEAKFKATVVVAPLFLPRLGRRLQPPEMTPVSGFRRIVYSGKNNGVLAANVMRHARRRQVKWK